MNLLKFCRITLSVKVLRNLSNMKISSAYRQININLGVFPLLASFLLVSCASRPNTQFQCMGDRRVIVKAKIKKIERLEGEVWVDDELWQATASTVNLKTLKIVQGNCSGSFLKVKVTESTPGYLKKGSTPYIYIESPQDLHLIPFVYWNFELKTF